jgi:cell division initiation protein
MTPNEILNKQFPRGMNGYKAEDVNLFMGEVGDYAKQLVKENAELQAKIEVLAEKLEEYRADEESLRSALIGAQKLGDSVIKEAKSKAQAILDEAAMQADAVMGNAKRDIELESYALDKKKLEAAKFKSQLLAMYKKQLDLINGMPFDEDSPPRMPEQVPVTERQPVAERVAVPERPSITGPSATEGEPEPSFGDVPGIRLAYSEVPDDAEDDKFPKRKSKFGNLRFGEGFDPVRDE